MATATKRFLITVDDPGGLIQDLELFETTRRFFDAEGVPATFFVVPRGADGFLLDEQPAWLAALREAEADGHDCQLHGLDHKDCEFGPYPAMIRVLHGTRDPDEALRLDTAAYGHNWRPKVYHEKLTTALGIYERALGRRPDFFRTGALSQAPELYEVMAELGLRYTSNLVTDPRGWEYIVENYADPGDWDPAVPPGPYALTDRVTNVPIISEYAWYLTPEKIPVHLALAVEDLGRVYAAGGVFLLVCHVQCVGAADGLSRELLRQLIAIARSDYAVEFQTATQLARDIEAGKVELLG